MRAGSLLSGLLLLGCSGQAPPSPVAQPRAAGVAPLDILPVTSASAAIEPAAPPWRAGDVLKHLPPRCDYGRAYVNLDGLFGSNGKAELARLAEKKLPLGDDQQGLRVVFDAFSSAGKNPYTALKEVGFCFDSADGRSVAALRIDLGGIDDPAGVLAKAIERKEGKPPKTEVANGFVWLEHREGHVAAVGENVVLVGYARETVASGAGGTLTPPDFADAARHLMWARIRDKDTSLQISAIGDDLDFRLETEVGPAAASMVSSLQLMLPQLDTLMGNDPKLAPLQPLMPAARRASFQASGERLIVSTRMPKTVVREVLQGFVDGPGLQLDDKGL